MWSISLVLQVLPQMRCAVSQPVHTVDNVHSQMKPIQVVQDNHIEWSCCRPLLLIASYMQTLVVARRYVRRWISQG